jgi:nucleotide-binding universal stress UspA family protein
MTTIVVGIDGSEGSIEALRFALDEARLRDARVRAIMAWELPVSAVAPTASWTPPSPDWTAFKEEAELRLKEALARVDSEGVEVVPEVIEAPAAQVLLEAGKDADMVVVGSRGRGGFLSLLLGSVSSQVVHHASCPVAVVPTPGTRDH